MLEFNLDIKNIFLILFFSIWRTFVFIGISVFSFLALKTFSDFGFPMVILAIILFLPFFLIILFVLHFAVKAVDKVIDKLNNKILKFVSINIIPPIVYILIDQYSSLIKDEDKLEYYLSIPFSFLIMYFFDKIIKKINKK